MNPAIQYQFIHAVVSVERLHEVEKAVLAVTSPQCVLMVTPRGSDDFSLIVGVPADEDHEVVIQTLESLASQTTTIGGRDTPKIQTYREGSSEPTVDF